MFTGIIQNLGKVKLIRKTHKQVRIAIHFRKKEKRVQEGESIAVNGVCLTAVKISSTGFEADLLPETLAVTSLGQLKAGDWVNLERSLKQGDLLGGHLVSGHVDATGEIAEIWRRGGNWSLLVHARKTILSKFVAKGSVAFDGVSLTIQKLEPQSFRVAVIPHTLKMTALRFLKVGSCVNLEADHSLDLMRVAKRKRTSSRFTVKSLMKQGF